MADAQDGSDHDELAALRAELAELRAEVRALRSTGAEPPNTGTDAGDDGLTRRRLMGRAGVAAAAAAVGGVLVGAEPAAAATGTFDGNPGVTGTANPVSGTGVRGTSTSGAGVVGESATGTGVQGVATGTNGAGMRAQSNGSGTSYGLVAQSNAAGGAGALVTTVANSGRPVALMVQGVFTDGSVGITSTARRAQLQLRTNDGLPARPTGLAVAREAGEIVYDVFSDLWLCVAGGTPGTWRKMSGPTTAGAFHVLPAPVRIYDSRPGTAPTVGVKSPLEPSKTRKLDAKVNASTVPAGATAVLLTLLLANATTGAGNLTVWAADKPKPAANTMVWGGSAGRFTATAVSALDASASINVSANLATDLVVDVVGYYR